MFAKFFLIYLGTTILHGFIPHKCGQGIFKDFSHIKDNNISEGHDFPRKLQPRTLGSINIYFDYTSLSRDVSKHQRKMMETFLPQAQKILSERVSVLKSRVKLRFSADECFGVIFVAFN